MIEGFLIIKILFYDNLRALKLGLISYSSIYLQLGVMMASDRKSRPCQSFNQMKKGDYVRDKNASAGNRTRVDSLEGYNSTSKLLMLLMSFVPVAVIFTSTPFIYLIFFILFPLSIELSKH